MLFEPHCQFSVLKPVFISIQTYCHELVWWLKICYFKCKRHTWDFCEEFTVWHFATKCAAVKFVKPWMSNHFSEQRDHSYVGSAMCPECPRKHCWLHPREKDPEVVPWLHLWLGLVQSWCVARDAGTAVGQGGAVKSWSNENLWKPKKSFPTMLATVQQQFWPRK